jgi:hypothetical protein
MKVLNCEDATLPGRYDVSLLGLLDLEDGGTPLFRNIGTYSPVDTI